MRAMTFATALARNVYGSESVTVRAYSPSVPTASTAGSSDDEVIGSGA